jgi:uncharacterized protein YlaI
LDLIDETKNDNKSVELHNLLNTDISIISKLDYELLNNKKDENVLTNQEYLTHRKYNLFNHYLYYDAFIINKMYNEERTDMISNLEDRIKEYSKEEQQDIDYIKDKKLLLMLNDTALWDRIIKYNNENIKTYIENENHYKNYKLYDFKSDFKRKYFRLKNLININIIEDDEDKKNDNETLEYRATNKLIFWLLKFLEIDIMRDFNKVVLKHYIIDNTKNKFIASIIEVLKNEIIIDDKPVKFIDFINKELLLDYNNCSNLKKHKLINIKTLDIKKNLLAIMTIIKFYLSKVNLYIDYGNNIKNQEKLLSSLQFTIRKEHDISTKDYIIPNNILFNVNLDDGRVEKYEKQINFISHNIMDKITNEEFIKKNNKFIDFKTNKNNPTITQLKSVNGYVKVVVTPIMKRNQENNYIEKDITNITVIPSIKIIYKDIIAEEIIEDVYGNKIIFKPITNIKRKNVDKNYYDETDKLNSELYTSYVVNTRTDIIKHIDSIKPNIINSNNLINQKIRAYNIKQYNERVNIKSVINIENGKVKLHLFTKKEEVKKRRYMNEFYDVNKREKLLNKINMEIKQPVKKTKIEDDIIKIKYDNVISELFYKRVTPILLKNKNDYINKFINNIIEVY